MKTQKRIPVSFVMLSLVVVFSVSITEAASSTIDNMRPPLSGNQQQFGTGTRPPLSGNQQQFGTGMRPPLSDNQQQFGTGMRPPLSGDQLNLNHSLQEITSMEINDELTNAISWMYNNGLTMYSEVSDFKVDNYLTREQAAKFFAQFAETILGKTTTSSNSDFSDILSADTTLQSYIQKAAKMGLLKGSKGKFSPQNKLTKAQAITIIVRSIDGTQDETGTKWYAKYYDLVSGYAILDGLNFDYNTLDSTNIKRGEVALLLYRLVNNGVVK